MEDLKYLGYDRNEEEHYFVDEANSSPGTNEIFIIKIPNEDVDTSVREVE